MPLKKYLIRLLSISISEYPSSIEVTLTESSPSTSPNLPDTTSSDGDGIFLYLDMMHSVSWHAGLQGNQFQLAGLMPNEWLIHHIQIISPWSNGTASSFLCEILSTEVQHIQIDILISGGKFSYSAFLINALGDRCITERKPSLSSKLPRSEETTVLPLSTGSKECLCIYTLLSTREFWLGFWLCQIFSFSENDWLYIFLAVLQNKMAWYMPGLWLESK